MNKILCLIMIILVLLCTACAKETPQRVEANPNVTPNQEVHIPEPVQETPIVAPVKTKASVDPDVLYAGMIPDPKATFADGEVFVTDGDGGTAYIFEVTGYKDGEYETYISQCKEMGFKDVYFETSEDFGAYSEDGDYWVQLSVDADKSIIYVICQTSKEK